MPIRRSQKKRNAEPRQKQNHRRLVIDTMVNPGSSAHRHQARSKADPARPHHRMVTLAQSSPGDRSACAPQSKTATVMLALKSLPVGTAYAVWTGIGAVGTAALGIYLFNEPATLLRLACIGLILSGIIGLKITS